MYEVSENAKGLLQKFASNLNNAAEQSKNKLLSVQKVQSEINIPLFLSFAEYVLSQFEELTNYINSNESEDQDVEIGITDEQAKDIINIIDICAAFIEKISEIVLNISDESLKDVNKENIAKEKEKIFKMIESSKEAIADMIISYEEDDEEIEGNNNEEYVPLLK